LIVSGHVKIRIKKMALNGVTKDKVAKKAHVGPNQPRKAALEKALVRKMIKDAKRRAAKATEGEA
jgi:hypothetical protein